MNEMMHPYPIERLFNDKIRLMRIFLATTKGFQEKFKIETDVEKKMDWVDELSDLREGHLRAVQALDAAIGHEKKQLNSHDVEILQGRETFKVAFEESLSLIREIQLTDQSLFLYIQNMGFELRAQILKGLKEKEALSKFKSQTQSATGEGLDQTV